MSAQAYYSHEDHCWYVPVASELFEQPDDLGPVEPVRVEIRDGEMWITTLLAVEQMTDEQLRDKGLQRIETLR